MDNPETPSDLEKADVALGKRVASHRDDPAVKAAGKVGELGDQEPLYAISAALALCGVLTLNARLARTGIALLAAVGAADAGKSLVKRYVKRTRPNALLEDGEEYESGAGGSERKPRQSFPSGHMAGTVAFGRTLSRTYPKSGAACGLASLGLGWSRVAKGDHWPLDVLAGAIVGLVAEEIGNRLFRALWPEGL